METEIDDAAPTAPRALPKAIDDGDVVVAHDGEFQGRQGRARCAGDDGCPPHVPAEFTVRDAASANWVVRKVVEARRYRQRVEAWAATEINRSIREERFFLDRYGRQLEEWTSREIDDQRRRRRSLSLPAGRVGFRWIPQSLRVVDGHALLNFCRCELPIALRVSLRVPGTALDSLERWREISCPDAELQLQVRKNTIREHFASTGEYPPGVDVVHGAETFFVK